jgi:diacylglycerol kinase family enzyme
MLFLVVVCRFFCCLQAAEIAAGMLKVVGPAMNCLPLTPADLATTIAEIAKLAKKYAASIVAPLRHVRLVVCGGDGSVAWVVCELQRANLAGIVPIAVIPVGTGNDLSNYMGWGATTMGLLGLFRAFSD